MYLALNFGTQSPPNYVAILSIAQHQTKVVTNERWYLLGEHFNIVPMYLVPSQDGCLMGRSSSYNKVTTVFIF